MFPHFWSPDATVIRRVSGAIASDEDGDEDDLPADIECLRIYHSFLSAGSTEGTQRMDLSDYLRLQLWSALFASKPL